MIPMSDAPARRATYADVLAAPEHVVAELIDGVLYQSPRPSTLHGLAASAIGEELGPPFKRGRGGPGGWMILNEPEVHLGEHVVVPDLAGWRRERLPEVPNAPYLELPPDWACEVCSPSTRALDRGRKLGVYAAHGVKHVWLVEPLDRLIEVLSLDGDAYRITQTATGDARCRNKPFEALELELSVLWAR
jgi:Uma2 family endonuclease